MSDLRYKRRLRFSILVLASQFFLIALALAWGIYLVLIAQNGGIISVENQPWILYGEIAATFTIIIFAILVIFVEFYRLRVRRNERPNGRDSGNST